MVKIKVIQNERINRVLRKKASFLSLIPYIFKELAKMCSCAMGSRDILIINISGRKQSVSQIFLHRNFYHKKIASKNYAVV